MCRAGRLVVVMFFSFCDRDGTNGRNGSFFLQSLFVCIQKFLFTHVKIILFLPLLP